MAAMNHPVRRLIAASLLSAMCALAACAAPAPGTSPAAATQVAVTSPPASVPPASTPTPPPAPNTAPQAPRSKPAPPMSAPLPPERMPEPGAKASPMEINTSCKVDADCAVRNVGSSQQPTCVNLNSPTNVPGAQAGGIKPIDHCQCHQGQCRAEVMQVNSLPAQTR